MAWPFGGGDSKRYVQSAWAHWIPAFAGMTWVGAGMTMVGERMTAVNCGNDGEGMTVGGVCAIRLGALDSRLRGNDVDGVRE